MDVNYKKGTLLLSAFTASVVFGPLSPSVANPASILVIAVGGL